MDIDSQPSLHNDVIPLSLQNIVWIPCPFYFHYDYRAKLSARTRRVQKVADDRAEKEIVNTNYLYNLLIWCNFFFN